MKITKIPLKWKTQISRLHPLSFFGSKVRLENFIKSPKKKNYHHPLNKIIKNPTNLNPYAHFLQPYIFPLRLIAKKMQEKQNSNFLNIQTLPKK